MLVIDVLRLLKSLSKQGAVPIHATVLRESPQPPQRVSLGTILLATRTIDVPMAFEDQAENWAHNALRRHKHRLAIILTQEVERTAEVMALFKLLLLQAERA